MRSLRHSLAVFAALLAGATHAHAQLPQAAFALNEGGAGNEYLSVATSTGLQGNSAYTIEAWVNPTLWTGSQTIVGNDYTTSFWLGLNPFGQVRFYPRGGVGAFVESPGTVPLNTWTHVAVTYNSATGYVMFLNGVAVALGNSILGAPGTSAGDLRIGADRETGAPAYFWHGWLDEVRIWNTARTSAQINETRLTGIGRPSSFTNGYYDACQASWTPEFPFVASVPDRGSGASNMADFMNGDYATETTWGDPWGAPVAPNVALKLNGIDDHVVVPVTENFVRGVTVMGWVAPTDISNFPTIAGRGFTTSFWLGVSSSGQLRFYPRGGTPVDGSTVISTGRWTHVAATYDGTRTTLYVNGQLDFTTTSISGPVGANGSDVWVGADNLGSGTPYAFPGYLDEIKIIQGALSPASVREHMFRGYPGYVPFLDVPDQDGVPVRMYHVSFDHAESFSIAGSSARIVRGGTAALSLLMPVAGTYAVSGFNQQIIGGFLLPNDDFAFSLGSDQVIPAAFTVSDVDVFISSPITNLADTRISLRSPAGTVRDLLIPGATSGRDLLTVIDDAASDTWATGHAPYPKGVRPSQSLLGFSGESSMGIWRLTLECFAPTSRVGLWAWGLRFNGQRTDVAGGAADAGGVGPGDPELRMAGPNPVVGASALAFDLARPARVDLVIHDVRGREVRRILSGEQQPGSFVMHVSSEGLAHGIYFATLRVDGETRGCVKLSIAR